MRVAWPTCSLEDVCEFQNGYAFKNVDYVDEPSDAYEVFRMGHICRGGGFNPDASKVFFPKSKAEKLERFILQKNDILMSMTDMKASMALLGHTALLPIGGRFLLNQRVGRITVRDRERLSFRFLYYYTNTEKSVQYLRSKANSGVQVNLSTNVIKESPVPLPPLPTQRKIAAILSGYDDLIENNLRRIKILEETAQNLYREWFVKFRYPGHQHARFTDSPLGRIPEGWEIDTVENTFPILGGGTPSTNVPEYWKNGTVNWFSPTDLTAAGSMFMDRSGNQISELGLKKSSARLFPAFSVMMTSRATLGVISINTTEASTNQGFITCIPNERFPLYMLFYWLKENVEYFISIGTGATFKEITKGVFKTIELVVPAPVIVTQFEDTVQQFALQVLNLQRKNIALRRTRDLLLPRLISGEVDVSDLDIAVPEEASA